MTTSDPVSYNDYILQHPEDEDAVYYIVTIFGCNSTPNDMWYPETYGFTEFTKAYEYYLKRMPNVNDLTNYAVRYIPTFEVAKLHQPSMIIDTCKQEAGYPSLNMKDDGTIISFAKRPYGAVLSRVKMN